MIAFSNFGISSPCVTFHKNVCGEEGKFVRNPFHKLCVKPLLDALLITGVELLMKSTAKLQVSEESQERNRKGCDCPSFSMSTSD